MKNNKLEDSVARRGRWGQERRLEFIDTRLTWEGRLNRSDLTDFFGISVPQSSLDLARYLELAPGNMEYDGSQRVYVAGPEFTPAVTDGSSGRYLAELYAIKLGILSPDVSFLGALPNADVVRHPVRTVPEAYLRETVTAIRDKAALTIVYQAVSHPEPTERTISPTALGYDGARWHIRGYCHLRGAFRDFVFARILALGPGAPLGGTIPIDEEWNRVLTVVIGPHPDLSEGQRRAIALDYGMANGALEIPCRQSLTYYLLRRLGVASSVARPPTEQQIVLLNRDDLKSWLPELA